MTPRRKAPGPSRTPVRSAAGPGGPEAIHNPYLDRALGLAPDAVPVTRDLLRNPA
ncbi:hypothetical protein [Kitasatospora sp. NPDC057500]|uniref:hypothetical protein n=1 Tax=Kitasatospora sp. NPDC057500 TaxID=3346151 RepID=UPI0036B54450